jgi:death-on-curing family protein
MWPGSDTISSNQYRNSGLIESAVNRPFHTFDGKDLYPTIFQKSAALFHSLVCNHCFEDGNKRTAVISIDLFLAANGHALAVPGNEMYSLAQLVASHNQRGLSQDQVLDHIVKTVEPLTASIESLKNHSDPAIIAVYETYSDIAESVRTNKLNDGVVA